MSLLLPQDQPTNPRALQARSVLLFTYTREAGIWVRTAVAFSASLQALGNLKTAEQMMRRRVCAMHTALA